MHGMSSGDADAGMDLRGTDARGSNAGAPRVIRMPDVFTRMQASTKASTLGLGCLLVGLAIRHAEVSFVIRALSIGAFMMLTTAVSAHAIARAAALSGAPLWEGTRTDERPGSAREAEE